MKTFLLCFIPLFVAIDPLGIMPLFLGLTKGLRLQNRRKVLFQSILTAFIISLLFLLAGHWIFRMLNIAMADFQIAGGILLLIIAILDLVHPTKEERQPSESVGIVPIGIPLVMGPAALTTLMMLSSQYSFLLIGLALIANLFFLLLVLQFAAKIEGWVGINGMKAFSKIVSLILAAIAVMFIRVGLQTALML